MATLRITNLTSAELLLSDFYANVAAGAYVDITRPANRLGELANLQSLIADGSVSLAVTYTADEIASGLLAPPQALQPQDLAPVAAATALGGLALIRVPLAAGGGGSPDDTQVYAVNALPFKFRVVDCWARVVTGVGGSTVAAYTQAAGAGTLLGTMSSAAAAARSPATDVTATAVAVPGATEGLFIRRSDDGVEAEVYLLIRPES